MLHPLRGAGTVAPNRLRLGGEDGQADAGASGEGRAFVTDPIAEEAEVTGDHMGTSGSEGVLLGLRGLVELPHVGEDHRGDLVVAGGLELFVDLERRELGQPNLQLLVVLRAVLVGEEAVVSETVLVQPSERQASGRVDDRGGLRGALLRHDGLLWAHWPGYER